ncbi:MAG: pantoate--beta-alanine ligase [Gammaproteobacteria bacterium]|nr:pantoate--beta-alanine ligase [Gammaproteobacteria bacterium]
MITVPDIETVRKQVRQWRADGCRVGFVATMGNLHEGHLSLLNTARKHADKVVASLFVNPLQFGPGEDFSAYPRTPDEDQAALESVSCDLLFAPDESTIYPDGDLSTRVVVGVLGDVLCGAQRKGHFDGMATVVTKLLNIVAPDIAVFGQKDYQQLIVIKHIVRDLNLPVRIISGSTIREADGLAMSSRNQYLTTAERAIAPLLHEVLLEVAGKIKDPTADYTAVCQAGLQRLQEAGFTPDYLELRDGRTLQETDATTRSVVVLAAAVLGRARLIDNVCLDLQDRSGQPIRRELTA